MSPNMPGTTVSAETRLLAAQIQTKDPKAIAKVVSVLKRKKGNVSATVEALGIKRATWYLWAKTVPELAAAVEEHTRGRIGRPPAKKKRAKSRPSARDSAS